MMPMPIFPHHHSHGKGASIYNNKMMSNTDKKNDYCQHFVNTGERPQNFIRDIRPEQRFAEYPRLDELIKIKDQIIKKRQTPPKYIKAELKTFDLTQLGKFDVVLMDPPWEEYSRRSHGYSFESSEKMVPWTFQEIASINIEALADIPSFLFLWVGGSENLEIGRELFRIWGYKRCEDIVWVKTNKSQKSKFIETSNKNTLLQRVKEHCLVGVKGDVRRASDSHFINANIDTDVIVEEEPPLGSLKKPDEIYSIIERFCLGRKRIELFAEISSIREGWLCVGNDLPDTNFDREEYNSWFEGEVSYPIVQDYKGGRYLGTTLEVENLRPKSPNRTNQSNMTGGSYENRSALGGNNSNNNNGNSNNNNNQNNNNNNNYNVSAIEEFQDDGRE